MTVSFYQVFFCCLLFNRFVWGTFLKRKSLTNEWMGNWLWKKKKRRNKVQNVIATCTILLVGGAVSSWELRRYYSLSALCRSLLVFHWNCETLSHQCNHISMYISFYFDSIYSHFQFVRKRNAKPGKTRVL